MRSSWIRQPTITLSPEPLNNGGVFINRKIESNNEPEQNKDFPALQPLLKTDFLGRNLYFRHSVESTNDLLKNLAYDGAPHGTVVIADEQTAGRGRLGRTWESAAGKGLWMSILLRPELHPYKVQSLTLAAAVSVCRAIEPFLNEKPGIKWPNDVLIGGRKVCGILTELSAEAERVLWVITGIGLNTHFSPDDFPAELRSKATSLDRHLRRGASLDHDRLAAEILNQFEPVYEDFVKNGPASTLIEWRERSITLGRMVELLYGQETMRALAMDIDEDGSLVVQLGDGSMRKILSGEISLRYDELPANG